MNTFFKKITAAAMAFALLGTGAAVTNSISKTTGKSFGIEADAAGWVIREGNTYWGLIKSGHTYDILKWDRWNLVPYYSAYYSNLVDVYAKTSGSSFDYTSLMVVLPNGKKEKHEKQ